GRWRSGWRSCGRRQGRPSKYSSCHYRGPSTRPRKNGAGSLRMTPHRFLLTTSRLPVRLNYLGMPRRLQLEHVARHFFRIQLNVAVLGEAVVARRLLEFLLYADTAIGINP